MEPKAVTLKPGDCVLYRDIESHEQAKAIADGFIAAGATAGIGYPYLENEEGWKCIYWCKESNGVSRNCFELSLNEHDCYRRLTPEQVIISHPVKPQTSIRGHRADFVIVDEVNQPSHYKREADDKLIDVRDAILSMDKNDPPDILNLECIEGMVSCLSTVDQIRGYLRGNSFKYRWRYEDKDRVKSLKKAAWYERRLEKLEEVEEKYSA
ncbi:hypothetical protein GCM10007160_18200 [Litchfieldella qijiaojingensis]|uniref:Uncharacterized protein n=1 Tax=Litchfieldella qijiaojingensis TaxID=980347 RepID=A0ABQ2YSE2_9GAMM|nr:DUF3310 domain-containing protein [Halomonas qijiaojingensis]GGX91082.1 hypothetical protein GCM10007160_18200 [Halomonas qijiaojingensis]